jgi:hypothetical protein
MEGWRDGGVEDGGSSDDRRSLPFERIHTDGNEQSSAGTVRMGLGKRKIFWICSFPASARLPARIIFQPTVPVSSPMRTFLYYLVLVVSLFALVGAGVAAFLGRSDLALNGVSMFLTGGGFLVLYESTANEGEEMLSRGPGVDAIESDSSA